MKKEIDLNEIKNTLKNKQKIYICGDVHDKKTKNHETRRL